MADDNELPESTDPTPREGPKALAAWEAYWALGSSRSLRKLAEQSGTKLSQLADWSGKYRWQERVLERQREEIAAAREAARKEAAALARRRLRNAQLMQEVGVTILAKADIAQFNTDAARELIAQAKTLIEAGMKAERLEVGEPSAILDLAPKKSLAEMDDDELAAYIAMLESQQ